MIKFPLLKIEEKLTKNENKMVNFSYNNVGLGAINYPNRKLSINETKHNKYLIDSLYSEKYTYKKDQMTTEQIDDIVDAFGYALMSKKKYNIGVDPYM